MHYHNLQPLFAVLLIIAAPALSSVPPPPVPCVLGNDAACPTGSTCTQTSTCRGLCVNFPTPPPLVPCTVGNNGPCPTGSTCTPTEVCPVAKPPKTEKPPPCGGACIATNPPPLTTNPPPPSVTCVVGANECPAPSTCTQTETCGGQCIGTKVPPPKPTTTAKACGYGHPCKKGFKCVGGKCVKVHY
ncbi:MAG: hypothetical protein M1831_006127 [Alyxoria varia]|nr:MAG: hypothetical protein M1831_006127 [Alyxoria varia]